MTDNDLFTTQHDSANLLRWNFFSIFTSILKITTGLYLCSDAYPMDFTTLMSKFNTFVQTELFLLPDTEWDSNLKQTLIDCLYFINGITTC